ncbi:hypothetical protein P280DRAFT_109466 [Massarina eburnea CBS 473.64]|uniref:Uncharacterized protein n=1 Tax=Massarina eburnea CBS 473.64 TaxID=1395130 RepID=A0A6A6RTN1_9PLEO|nr:hypothetical protein P280DRAFT_109466 [Massarina eburnea CBS 473.64]
MSANPGSSAPFFSFGLDDGFISKNFEGLRYRRLPPSLNDLITNGNVLDVQWASLGPIPESWILSFTDSTAKQNLAWGASIPRRLQTHLSKLTPSPFLRTFLGPSGSYIVWDASSIRWAFLPATLEDTLQSWLTPSGWKAGPPRIVTWGEEDAFFAMSEYGDVAYRLGGKGGNGEWEIWKETVEEWRGESGFVWSEVAYISIDPVTTDQFVAIRNDGTWAGSIDDSNETALENFVVNFFRLTKKKPRPESTPQPQTNNYHQYSQSYSHSNSQSRANGEYHQRSKSQPHPRPAETKPDTVTQAQYESWATSTASSFASALAANTASPTHKAPKKLQVRSQSSSIPASSTSVGQGKLLSTFPYLPTSVTTCKLPACAAQKSDPSSLRACKHDVERLLRASGLYSYEWLRQERIRWHPDRFGRMCEEGWRDEGRRLAEEMFKCIDTLIGEARGRS